MDFDHLKTPCYVIDQDKLIKNLEILKRVKDQTHCKILLANKAFSMYSVFPLIGKYLDGITASSLFEAKLGREEMNKEVHIFSPAYIPDDFSEITKACDHIVFNSFAQYERYKNQVVGISCGLRINPEYSEQDVMIYDPCGRYSRLGITLKEFKGDLSGIEGLHFHSLCEQNADTLYRTLMIVDQKFGSYLKQMKWINFGGGHHITRDDYDIELLIKAIRFMQDKYGLVVYLEPGEAIALNAGYLVSSVLDFNYNEIENCILDVSAACHMPDVLEMPYRPRVMGSGDYSNKYRFGGPTCLAGDVIGEYAFREPLKIGDKVVFEDMAIYTMVKNNMFNGINLPSIILRHDGKDEIIKTFSYHDYKSRL